MLDSYEPAIWRLAVGSETRVVAVLLGGHYPSTVEGLPPGTPVTHAELQSLVERPKPAPACSRLQFWTYSAHRGGPDALLFDRHVFAVTGRHIDALHGGDNLKSVTVN